MRNSFSILIKGAFAALFMCLAGAVWAQQATFSRQDLEIKSGDKTHKFTVELALDDEQRMQGLMFRKEMAPDAGMLFDFGDTRRVQMWMENTILPLDMVFIEKDGTISSVHADAVPYSRDIIDSKTPVHFVLELNAGRAKALGIKPGDKVVSKQIGNAS
ncbi:DUF192 domain-containing protein [Neorhizobium lilium]|uniref:DUF192 domain-containing protein n=1 Tax=Neorhizobium lilium TaxID=2503024 RepID=A0A444LCQ7_9HYPH|nr:DUF192 domain-containing protein [Neorhizobium lilium]RWX75633.1 DUF192 domain-containing protein [Neorhizobium lilium]